MHAVHYYNFNAIPGRLFALGHCLCPLLAMGGRGGKGVEEPKTSFMTMEARGLQRLLLGLQAAHLPPLSFGNVKDEHWEGCFPTTQAGQHSTHLLQDAFPDLSLPTELSSFSQG